jgi:UDP-N-acetylmuramyl pentapeptide phosphotransferase/UDP-N-acetylglucosamine-1-phosphate transferase
MNSFILLCIVFILSFFLTIIIKNLARGRYLIDFPNERSSHSIPTPRAGGIAIIPIWFAGLIYLFINHRVDNSLFFALMSGIPIAIVGFLDDLVKLKPAVRFIVQIISASFALYFLKGLNHIQLLNLTIQLAVPLTILGLFGLVWATNLFNFLDGIDGYIGTEVIFIGIAIYLLTGEFTLLLFSFVILGFLIWNWQPAKIFLGDAGSTLCGFSIAVVAIYHQNINISSLPVWLILSSVFWFDATLTLFRRIKNREHISEAHRNHFYQRIVLSGFTHQKTVFWALILNLAGFIFANLAWHFKTYDWIFLILDVILLILVCRYIDRKYPFPYKNQVN